MTTKTDEEYLYDLHNAIVVRRRYHEKWRLGIATEEDREEVIRCQQLAKEARDAGFTLPCFCG